MANNFTEKANFLWSIADLIRDDFKRGKYQDVILPLTVLRRIDSVLEPTKDQVLGGYNQYKDKLNVKVEFCARLPAMPFTTLRLIPSSACWTTRIILPKT